MKIDNTDRKIINILLENSKLSVREIGKKVGVSAVTVLKRIKLLEKEKVIKGYTTQVDYEKLGYDITVIENMKVERGKMVELKARLSKEPNVFGIYDITGVYDAMMLGKFKNRRTLDAFLKRLRKNYDFIIETKTIIVMDTIKEGIVKIE